jgi:hypothetical protein
MIPDGEDRSSLQGSEFTIDADVAIVAIGNGPIRFPQDDAGTRAQ